jgi:hypothetical protein
MNDEDFARDAFAAAVRSGWAGEPPTMPDVDGLAFRARRASRNRRGVYAAGTTALAGVVTAGVVTGPTLLGLGNGSPSGFSAASGSGSGSVSKSASGSASDPRKQSVGVACATPPRVGWAAVIASALHPSEPVVAEGSVNCFDLADGSRSMRGLFKLSSRDVEFQVNVESGGGVAAKFGGQAGARASKSPLASAPADAQALASLEGQKSAATNQQALASQDAHKRALAASDAATSTSASGTGTPSTGTAKMPPGTDGSGGPSPKPTPTCTEVAPQETACVTHLTKGQVNATDVQLVRMGSNAVIVEVIASTGQAATPATVPLPADAQVIAVALAIAAHV